MFDKLIDVLIDYGNLIEGIFWIVIGACFAIALLWPKRRAAKGLAAITFVAFGCSDFVECYTGAWWRPWWLLAWKATCICIMVLQLVAHIRHKKLEKSGG